MNSIATSARWACRASGPHRRAFTLTELLFVMMILAILAALSLSALSGATQQARIERTRAIINRLDKLITEKYDSYRTRALPIRINPGFRPVGEPYVDTLADDNLTNGMRDNGENFTDQDGDNQYDIGAGELRLGAMRELMRLELPSLKADVVVGPAQLPYLPNVPAQYALNFLSARPAVNKNYLRRAGSIPGGLAAWTEANEGAECLYLIVSAMRDGEDSALDFFAPSEIGDIDNDGMSEIHDAWGNPIDFVRWPVGYSENWGVNSPNLEWGNPGVDDDGDGINDNSSEAGWPGSDDILPPPTPQTRNFVKAPDPFDPLRVDGRSRLPNRFIVPFALKPLVYSPGPDKEYDVRGLDYGRFASGAFVDLPDAASRQLLDPYRVSFSGTPAGLSAGTPFDPDGQAGFADNITNHDFSEK